MIVYVVYYNELKGGIADIFSTEKKAKDFIKDGNGLYMDMVKSYTVK